MINRNNPVPKNDQVSLSQRNIDFSFNLSNAFKGKKNINKILPCSPYQQNCNNKILSSNNLANSYSNICTQDSFYSKNSSNPFYLNSNTTLSNKNIKLPISINIFNSQNSNILSPINYETNLNLNCTNNQSNILTNLINNNAINEQKLKQNNNSININNNNIIFNNNNKYLFNNKKTINLSKDNKKNNNDKKINYQNIIKIIILK